MPKKIEKAHALSDAKIQFVSLVDKAANKRQFLITKAEGDSASFQSYGRIVKADSSTHEVTGIVYEPMAEDTDGEYMTAEEIEKAAHWYMKNSGSVDIQHCFVKAENIHVVESHIAKCDEDYDGTTVKKGTWVMTAEIEDDAVWDSIQKGEITGFSMGGIATRSDEDVDLNAAEDVEKAEDSGEAPDSLFGRITKAIKDVFNSEKRQDKVEKGEMADRFNAQAKEKNLSTAWYALRDTFEGYQYDESTGSWGWGYTADESKIREALTDFNAIVTKILTSDNIIGEIEKAAKEAPIQKAGKSLSSKNYNALKTICGNLQSFLAEFEDGSDDAEAGDAGDDGAGVEKSDHDKKEVIEMTKSEVESLVTEVVKAQLEPITAQIAEITKAEQPETQETKEVTKDEADDPKADEVTTDVVKSVVTEALTEALAPITQQIDAIKKSRALPSNLNGGPDSEVNKSEVHYLHGIL